MIKGKINPPKFKTENEKIVKRHMNAAIIASFWRSNRDGYKNVGTFFSDPYYPSLLGYINQLPKANVAYINAFIPSQLSNKVTIWINDLSADEGILNREYQSYLEEFG